MKFILDTPTHKVSVPVEAELSGHIPIHRITTQAFYRRLTKVERTILRLSNAEDVADMREDLQRNSDIDLDGILKRQLVDTTLFTQARVDELLVDGTPEEAKL